MTARLHLVLSLKVLKQMQWLRMRKLKKNYPKSRKNRGLAFGIIYTAWDPTNTSLIDHIDEPHEAWRILKSHHVRADVDTLIRLNDKLSNCFMLENELVATFRKQLLDSPKVGRKPWPI
eukprot:TRINITY_DN19412_c0_g1_i1.p1 TRINITY_DN19412_c0_g1~~TRINITY_DN19412_c0_g1_i1.p1  ORF type:complete len:119 (+),score=11.34 TRINITY_DN19412_c0_g1_i1:241-597(+)